MQFQGSDKQHNIEIKVGPKKEQYLFTIPAKRISNHKKTEIFSVS